MNNEVYSYYQGLNNCLRVGGVWMYPDSGSLWTKTDEDKWERTVPGDTQMDKRAARDLMKIGCLVKL